MYDAQTARLTYDPIVPGGLRVIREEPDIQADRHTWVEGWREETERHLTAARDRDLLVSDADPSAISRTLLATVVGHHQLAETQPDGPNTWDRMTTTWLGLLATMATTAWLRNWTNSNWSNRPAPTREQYEHAREPTFAPEVEDTDDEAGPDRCRRR